MTSAQLSCLPTQVSPMISFIGHGAQSLASFIYRLRRRFIGGLGWRFIDWLGRHLIGWNNQRWRIFNCLLIDVANHH